jgi:hypothetical protein
MESPYSEPRITTAHSQLTEKSISCYIASSGTAPTIIPSLNVVFSELLPSNGSLVCYRGKVFTFVA